jgi:hypothetical protein
MSDKETINWPGLHSKIITPGYALLHLAADSNLSASVIDCYVSHGAVGRSLTWIKKRRWLPSTARPNNAKGPTPNIDRYVLPPRFDVEVNEALVVVCVE